MSTGSGNRSGWQRLGAAGATLALLLAGCGSDGGSSATAATDDSGDGPAATDSSGDGGAAPETAAEQEPVTLTMDLFGDFGYEPLIDEYMQMHPNVTIETTISEFAAHHDALTTAFAAGSGAPDIAAVEVGFIAAMKGFPDNFHDLQELAGDEPVADRYLDWKWQQATTIDGSATIGMPTDIGPMALCYRRDLFEAAGLPSGREEVSALLTDWDAFIEAGEALAKTGVAIANNAAIMYQAIVGQADETYYDSDGNLIYADNPAVRAAWDTTVRAIEAGVTANIALWSAEWNAGMGNGDYATLTCPAWMMAYIQGQAPDTAGQWDIASLPGGSGNWGGSFLTLPAQGQHPEEAYDFIEWLLAPEQQLSVFVNNGNFPSIPALYETAEITDLTSEFFNGAPAGEIYVEQATEVTQPPLGPDYETIDVAFEDGLARVESGQQAPDESWAQTLAQIEQEVG